ncbi:phosphoribosylamine--glycine ligase [Tissierella praeacuta DSM 18095]|uniref:Phosphoribosylamine--glycine ligase n=1 Tax=Tissierella praeacuta DSM 18095 TaxID=1123404 RepID=A0A1M4W815_9FIRM|nr:phosphoribosylamine--glycine ligase [Tissierella praeacuta]TCU75571.1 phosphoribosylamine--glycine ligase [Tissierella praeacuta]SHE77300.1 phosphoribosylamine--glycine ligase [Tissierella praeacuta DSM 18095]SUO99997.1 Phosphoribosylamine--glycine ligase [Tissierella praeacuta]
MKVLVIGSGGREHALCWKISKSQRVSKVYCAPGNGGTLEVAENIPINVDEIEKLVQFAIENNIDLTVVGPELPLVLGIVDKFQEKELKIFGVNKTCAQLEGSKDFSKEFMEKYNIPTAKYKSYINLDEAIEGLEEFTYPLVIKADGLCAGKGVVICNSEEEAINTLKSILGDKVFGSEGEKVVIEEFLDGIEASLLCLVTKDKIIPMESAKDYKKIYEGDKGLNTGGVGCYSPSPLFNDELNGKIERNILENILIGLNQEKMDFRGILFIGLMLVNGEPKVLEFNVRFGDPETEVLIPRLESDIIDIFEKTIDGSLNSSDLIWKENVCVTVVLTSSGYPENYEKGFKITGMEKLDKDIILFHNGTKKLDNDLITNGGRVLSITCLGKTVEEARENIYLDIDNINFDGMRYRKDIGKLKF